MHLHWAHLILTLSSIVTIDITPVSYALQYFILEGRHLEARFRDFQNLF